MLKFIRQTALWVLLLPIATYGVGAASNQLVIIANDGKFPVQMNPMSRALHSAKVATEVAAIMNAVDADDQDSINDAEAKVFVIRTAEKAGMLDDIHCIMTPATHLNLLADIFDIGGIYSVGDGLLSIAEQSYEYCAMLWIFLLCAKVTRQEN